MSSRELEVSACILSVGNGILWGFGETVNFKRPIVWFKYEAGDPRLPARLILRGLETSEFHRDDMHLHHFVTN